MHAKTYDYLVVGGGIFGVYAAIYLAKKNQKVLLIEKESELLQKASVVNQARLHNGYHYPRSIATARIANDHKGRFIKDHKQFINSKFDKYYAIDKYSSFTDCMQFERFCTYLDIPVKKIKQHDLFKVDRIEQLYLVEEYSFDPMMIAEYYKELIKEEKNITVNMASCVISAEKDSDCWKVNIADRLHDTRFRIKASGIINATYSGTNTINRIFDVKKLDLMHEITEIAFISSPLLQSIGLTIMDGHFCSIMPYGLSNFLSLSSVVYTHHKVSYRDEPTFDCQEINKECRSDYLSICDSCKAQPKSNYYKMLNHMKHYIADSVTLDYMFSMYTIKSKLQASYIDDGRPTEISKLNSNPDYYCLFAGKINSIYEIERELNCA